MCLAKLRLWRIWANKTGNSYSYLMAFKGNPIKNAYLVDDLVEVIKEL